MLSYFKSYRFKIGIVYLLKKLNLHHELLNFYFDLDPEDPLFRPNRFDDEESKESDEGKGKGINYKDQTILDYCEEKCNSSNDSMGMDLWI